MELIKSQTYQNLAKAFAGESQARTRYKFLSYCAKNEDLEALAKQIDEVQSQEFTHARMFYTAIQSASAETLKNIDICAGYPFKEKWNLKDNLKFASENEEDEATKIYPSFAKIAQSEGFSDIAQLFTLISEVENCHHKMFTQLYQKISSNALYENPTPYKWKCSSCGHEATALSAWKICPLCKQTQGYVMLNLNS